MFFAGCNSISGEQTVRPERGPWVIGTETITRASSQQGLAGSRDLQTGMCVCASMLPQRVSKQS
jgi:hypothetical protein